MSNLSRILGDVMKTARGKTDLSQQQVAKAAGVDNRTILNIENYRGNPLFSNLYALVRFYKLDPRVIFYPELQQQSPAVSRLNVLISDCTEEEAEKLYPLVQSALRMLRNDSPYSIQK